MCNKIASFALASILALPIAVRAQPTPTNSPSISQGKIPCKDEEKKRSVELFNKGMERVKAHDEPGALRFFLESKNMCRDSDNTVNAAHFLHVLGRYDEALDMYLELLLDYFTELSPDEDKQVRAAIEDLRKKTGSIMMSANVGGAMTVDGLQRAALPLFRPVRVIAGRRTIRISNSYYMPAEQTIDVPPGQMVKREVTLRPLPSVSALYVESRGGDGAEMFVDGTRVGVTPLEVTVSPGNHIVWIQKGDKVSALKAVTTTLGKTEKIELVANTIGASVEIITDPASATILIDGQTVGRGWWRGPLAIGPHNVIAAEVGYIARAQRVEIPQRPDVTITLQRDLRHSRWREQGDGRLAIGAFFSPFFFARYFKDYGVSANGGLVGTRLSYELAPGISPEVVLGYRFLSGARTQKVLHGPFAGLGYSYHFPQKWPLKFVARVTGAVAASIISPNYFAASAIGMPEFGVGWARDTLHVDASIGAAFLLREVRAQLWEGSRTPPTSDGPTVGFLAWAPQLSVSYAF